jgi:hypothetical protein
MINKQIRHPSAWKAEQFKNQQDFAIDLGAAELIELEQFVDSVKALDLAQVEASHLAYPALRALMDRIYAEMRDGRGFVLLRGLPVHHYALCDIEKAYWALGTHMGEGLSQSVMGDRLGHVMDMTREDPAARAYRNRGELNPHTDMADMIGLACIRGAKTGGVSLLTSAIAIHNEMAEHHPEYLARLYEGFHVHRFGEEQPGELPYTPHKVPVFSCVDEQVSVRFIKTFIVAGQTAAGSPLTAFEEKAIEKFVEIANRDDFQLRFVMKAGEVQFINNFTHLHARTEFEDFDEPDKRRHMLRLWLHKPEFRARSKNLNLFEGEGYKVKAGQRPAFDLGTVKAATKASRL